MPHRSSLQISLEIIPKDDSRPEASRVCVDYGFYRTPMGRCLLAETRGKICYLAFAPAGSDQEMLDDLSARWPVAELNCDSETTASSVSRIFTDNDSKHHKVELLVRGTSFQVAVWKALLETPAGSVCSYADIAQRVGRPKAVRAVGTAIGANPIAWLIPCHRVLRSDGGLGGYRWGIEMKQACLEYEKALLNT